MNQFARGHASNNFWFLCLSLSPPSLHLANAVAMVLTVSRLHSFASQSPYRRRCLSLSLSWWHICVACPSVILTRNRCTCYFLHRVQLKVYIISIRIRSVQLSKGLFVFDVRPPPPRAAKRVTKGSDVALSVYLVHFIFFKLIYNQK